MDPWKLLVAKLSLFPGHGVQGLPDAAKMFEKAWEAEPLQYQRSQNPLSPSTAQGVRGPIAVSTSVTPARIDLEMLAQPQDATLISQMPLIADTAAARREIERLIGVVPEGLLTQPVVRVALYVQFCLPRQSWRDANQALSTVIPIDLRPKLTDEEEVSLQMNSPIPVQLDAETGRLNRICRWSVNTFQFFAIPVSLTPVETIAANISFDINNRPGKQLSLNDQHAIFSRSLTELNARLAECGLEINGFK